MSTHRFCDDTFDNDSTHKTSIVVLEETETSVRHPATWIVARMMRNQGQANTIDVCNEHMPLAVGKLIRQALNESNPLHQQATSQIVVTRIFP